MVSLPFLSLADTPKRKKERGTRCGSCERGAVAAVAVLYEAYPFVTHVSIIC